jgi:hypothetical protein
VQIRELLAIATLLHASLVKILARAIARDELGRAYRDVLVYAESAPARARFEAGIVRTRTPEIARHVGDALVEGANESGEGESKPLGPRARALWIAVGIVAMCVLVATILVVTRPTTNGWTPRVPAKQRSPAIDYTLAVEEPTPDLASESRTESIRAISHSLKVLRSHGWFDANRAFEGLQQALARGECDRASAMVRWATDSESPEIAAPIAQRHLASIRTRVTRLCSAETALPAE